MSGELRCGGVRRVWGSETAVYMHVCVELNWVLMWLVWESGLCVWEWDVCVGMGCVCRV